MYVDFIRMTVPVGICTHKSAQAFLRCTIFRMSMYYTHGTHTLSVASQSPILGLDVFPRSTRQSGAKRYLNNAPRLHARLRAFRIRQPLQGAHRHDSKNWVAVKELS